MPAKGKQKPIFDDVLQKPKTPPPPEEEDRAPGGEARGSGLPGDGRGESGRAGEKKRSLLTDSLNPDGGRRTQISPIIQNRSVEAQAARTPEEPEGIRMAATRPKKKDTRRREPIVNFRCIPKKVKSELDQLTIRYDLPMGVLVTFIFESGLQDLEAGKLVLKPTVTRAGRSLYADKQARVGRPVGGGAKGGRRPEERETIQTAFRGVPTSLRDKIRDVAESQGMKVPVGEVARALLEHGIKHIKNGHWPIDR